MYTLDINLRAKKRERRKKYPRKKYLFLSYIRAGDSDWPDVEPPSDLKSILMYGTGYSQRLSAPLGKKSRSCSRPTASRRESEVWVISIHYTLTWNLNEDDLREWISGKNLPSYFIRQREMTKKWQNVIHRLPHAETVNLKVLYHSLRKESFSVYQTHTSSGLNHSQKIQVGAIIGMASTTKIDIFWRTYQGREELSIPQAKTRA